MTAGLRRADSLNQNSIAKGIPFDSVCPDHALRKFIEIRPSHPHSYWQLSHLALKLRRNDRAIAFAQTVTLGGSENITYQTLLVRIASERK